MLLCWHQSQRFLYHRFYVNAVPRLAHAFTLRRRFGNNVVFGRGENQPGRFVVIATELTTDAF